MAGSKFHWQWPVLSHLVCGNKPKGDNNYAKSVQSYYMQPFSGNNLEMKVLFEEMHNLPCLQLYLLSLCTKNSKEKGRAYYSLTDLT